MRSLAGWTVDPAGTRSSTRSGAPTGEPAARGQPQRCRCRPTGGHPGTRAAAARARLARGATGCPARASSVGRAERAGLAAPRARESGSAPSNNADIRAPARRRSPRLGGPASDPERQPPGDPRPLSQQPGLAHPGTSFDRARPRRSPDRTRSSCVAELRPARHPGRGPSGSGRRGRRLHDVESMQHVASAGI